LALCVAVGTILIAREAEYRAARSEYTAIQAILDTTVTSTDTLPTPTVFPNEEIAATAPIINPTPKPFYSARVAQLQKDNRDTVAWLNIPDTIIQYPIVQGTDNTYYMTHTFKKKRNASGAIFLDCWNSPAFTDFNTVIYGHNMKDGSMFNSLREYRHQGFFDEHPYVEITLLNTKLLYRVFAAYTSQGKESEDFRGQGLDTETQRSAFIKTVRRRSTSVSSFTTVSRHDRLLTLVTCTGSSQQWFWVVHAVLMEEM